MRKISLIAAVIGSILVSSTASAGTRATLNVKGTINPPPCDISLSGDLAFNNIDTTKLSSTIFTDLPGKKTSVSVSCAGEAYFGLKVSDNSDLVAEKAGVSGEKMASLFSLGANDEGKSIGVYTINVKPKESRVDNNSGAGVQVWRGGEWHETSDTFMKNNKVDPDSIIDLWTINRGEQVHGHIPAKSKLFSLEISPSIAPLTSSQAMRSVNLNGSATFEVVYI